MSRLSHKLSRRLFVTGALATTTAACGNGVGGDGGAKIDARVDSTLNTLHNRYPATLDLKNKSVGMLVMPLITKAGFGIGGAYGRGALQVNGVTVDYYSTAAASFGLQIGAQQFSHVLYFMTDESLRDFRSSAGWAAGADLEYAVNDKGGNVSTDTTTVLAPVIAVIFGQAGLLVGATLEGTKYTRIIP
ncbi:MAG: twin-arginine translocation pathway signal [Marinosulfonomonas sp.]|nr:twin-arginine translocation pathway signal [Marinosulfonomonas sp.]